MATPTNQGGGPTPLAEDVVDLDISDADLVAELSGMSDADLEGVNESPENVPVPDPAPPAADPPAPEKAPEPQPDEKAEAAPAPEPEKGDDNPPTDKAAEELEWIERREAASRQKIEQEREKARAEVLKEAEQLKADLMKQFPAEIVEKAQLLSQLEGADDRTIAEYFWRRSKGEDHGPGDVLEKHRRRQGQDKKQDERDSRIEALERRIQQQEGERKVNEYMGAIGDEYPHLKQWQSSMPDEVFVQVGHTAAAYLQQYGILPTPKELLTSMEKSRSQYFEALGYAPRTQPTPEPSPTPQKEPTPATKAPAAIPSEIGSSTPTESEPANLDDLELTVIRELQEARQGNRDLG